MPVGEMIAVTVRKRDVAELKEQRIEDEAGARGRIGDREPENQ